MSRMALICTLLLAATMSATGASRDSKKTTTVPRDISGVVVGTLTFELDPEAPLGSFGIRSIFDATGNLTHLGAATTHIEHTPWPGAEGLVTDGEATIIAANGDQIWCTYEGTTEQPDPEHVIGHASFVVMGGTGRFALATGTIEATAYVTVGEYVIGAIWSADWVLEGTVSY